MSKSNVQLCATLRNRGNFVDNWLPDSSAARAEELRHLSHRDSLSWAGNCIGSSGNEALAATMGRG